MRILYVLADGRLGGGPTYVLCLLAGLGDRVEFGLVTQRRSYLAYQARRLHVPVFEMEFSMGRANPISCIRLREVIGRFGPDIISAHGGRSGFILFAGFPRVPVVYKIGGLHCAYKHEPMRTLEAHGHRFVMRRSSRVVFAAEHDRALAETMGLLPTGDRVSVIHNGVDPLAIPKATSPLWDVGFIGRFSREKDPILFLRTMRLLPEYSAVMVGGGNLESKVAATAKGWGLEGRLELKGALSRSEALEILARVRVLVMTSLWEGLPILAVEALAAGVPVVAPAVGGVPEVLGGECGGLLVRRCPESIADAVRLVLREPGLAHRLVDRGRQRLMAEFTEEVMLRKQLQVYESALCSAGSRGNARASNESAKVQGAAHDELPEEQYPEMEPKTISKGRALADSTGTSVETLKCANALVVEEEPVLGAARKAAEVRVSSSEWQGSGSILRSESRRLHSRIGLNISSAYGDFAGVGSYAFQLARHLAKIEPAVDWVFFGPDAALVPALSRANTRVVVAGKSGPSRILWEQTMLPLSAHGEQIDLLHCADFSQPIAYRGPAINTIHDLSPYADSQFFSASKRAYKQALIPLAARRSLAIITVSDFSRGEILNRFPFLEGRVFAIHHGVEPAANLTNHSASPPFLLFVGTLENRKNLVALVRAFRILRERRQIPHHLVLAGKRGFGWESIRDAIRESGVSEAIEMRGYVRQSEFVKLYQSASALVYPSMYEGFGLPLLEAMAHGTPVICSNAASLPEVGGEAVVYFDPHSVDDMACAIERVLDSPSLQAELREKGLRRAATFTWEECARKHVEVYRKVLEQ